MTRVAVLRLSVSAAGFALLELLCRTGIIRAFTFPPPSSTVVSAVVINTLNGLDRVPHVFDKVAHVLRLDPTAAAWRIRLPYASPYVFTGFKLAVAYSFVGVIGAEFITSSKGVGYQIAFAYNN